MIGNALAHAVSGADVSLAVCCALLIFSGLLGPLEPKARAHRKFRRTVRPSGEPASKGRADRPAEEDRPEVTAGSLNAIELALIVELNLERARDHDAVANDTARLPEVRKAAAAAATAWRERARMFELEAGRRSEHPVISGDSAPMMDFTYTGPERRRHLRRRETRRGDGQPVSERRDRLDRFDRRTGPERRGEDRRRRELAAR